MYKVLISKNAEKELGKIPDPYYSNIKSTIRELSKAPRPIGCKKLRNRDAYRVRVANYRIIYEITDTSLLIHVINIGHRKDIYK